MEARRHKIILRSTAWFIVLVTVLTAGASFFVAFLRPETTSAVVSFNIQLINRPPTTDYQYGAYYDLKAAEAYTQHLMSWFMTPAIIKEVYELAGIRYEIKTLAKFTNRFKTKQYSSQNFAIIFNDPQRVNAEKLSKAVQRVVIERAPEAVKLQEQPVFNVESLEPVIVNQKFNLWLAAGLGAISGLILSLILVYIREYFK